jgi:hypothetical protein
MTSPRPAQAISELVASALTVSASLAQVVAEASTGKPQPHVPSETALQSVVRHATTTVSSLVSTAVAATRKPAGPSQPVLQLQAGGSLRLPLSIDNPGSSPMTGIVPRMVSAEQGIAVSFVPEVLDIAPLDFEKLVVMVSAAPDAARGLRTVAFVLTGQEDQPISLTFDVTD